MEMKHNMKQIAVFGAGDIGRVVLKWLGSELVRFFFVNEKKEDSINGIPVLSYEEFLKQKEEVFIIIASTKYDEEMSRQLRSDGIDKFFIWNQRVMDLFAEEILRTFPRYNPIYSGKDWSYQPYSLIRSFFLQEALMHGKILLYAYPETTEILLELLDVIGKRDKVVTVIHPGKAEKPTFDSAKEHIDCVLCAVNREDNALSDSYEQIREIQTVDLYDIAQFLPEFHCEEIKKYKDAYKGKRCFIIGNGPSLKAEDLEKLHQNNEITFASNKIYKIFEQTNWRPDFYFCTDQWLFRTETKDILNMEPKICSFYNYAFCNGTVLWISDEKILPIYNMTEQPSPLRMPRFSKDLSIYHVDGRSVTYAMLQAAFYMGFDKVYLLGMDHYPDSLINIKSTEHFYNSDKDRLWDLLPEHVKIDNHITLLNSYKKARLVFEEDGRNIFNATRGGYLEVFERVKFDDLF